MEDEVPVEEGGGLRALDPLLVVADESALVESRSLGAEEGPPAAALGAHVVHLQGGFSHRLIKMCFRLYLAKICQSSDCTIAERHKEETKTVVQEVA